MKRSVTLLLGALFICSGLFMTSCSNTNEQVFAKRKYMPWFKTVKQKSQDKPEEFISQNNIEVDRPDAMVPVGEASNGTGILTELLPKQEILWNSITKRAVKKAPKKVATGNYLRGGNVAHSSPEAMSSFSQSQEVEFQLNQHLKEDKGAEVVAEGIVLILLVILAIILPPLAVLLVDGLGMSFLLSILLTLLFWLPGVIYALIRIFAS